MRYFEFLKVNAKHAPKKRESIHSQFTTGKNRAKSINSQSAALKIQVDVFRNKLLAGNMMTKHHKSNNPRKRHIVITPDLRMIGWKEASMKGSKFKGKLKKCVLKKCVFQVELSVLVITTFTNNRL